jgi:hypothetical protein
MNRIEKANFVLIIILFGLIHIYCKAQPYESIFGHISTEWNIIPYGVCDGMYTMTTSVIGDSVINGQNYKGVDHYSGFNYDTGFLREDTISGKVWFYNKTIEREILVMDLSLNATDSFKIYYNALDSTYIFVDTLFINNGIKHILFKHCYIHICAPDEQFEFIEGTGTNAGLFYVDTWYENSFFSYLLCHKKDGEKIYGNSLFNDTCFIDMVGIDDVLQHDEFEIYPNPSSELIVIPFDQEIKVHIEIYNNLGNLIVQKNIFNEKQINISKYLPGIYIVRINNGAKVFIKKFIKI